MKYNKRNNKAFTLIELLIAIAIFVIVISLSGQVFKVCIESHRVALANAEIMQKFRAVTSQLNSDFEGLDKDGEIYAVWSARELQDNTYVDNDLDGYERFDRIMFFAEGDFQEYYGKYTDGNRIRGNLARICYSLARSGTLKPEQQDKPDRTLARTLHILTKDETLPVLFDPNNYIAQEWFEWNNYYQYDKISRDQWKYLNINNKADILSFILDINVKIDDGNGNIIYESQTDKNLRGTAIDKSDPNTMHMILCEGVGEFKIQGWDNMNQTWIPEIDPDSDGDLSDTHFFLNDPDPNNTPGVLYSWPYKAVKINNIPVVNPNLINKENFNSIPGLGRALKFTFTIFDSKGIIKAGRTFTHIVYLDN